MVDEAVDRAKNILTNFGRAYLSIMFPRDFEVYFCSFELCSFEGELIDFFSFPILPNTVSKKESYLSNIKKTYGGITVIKNDDFIPQELSLRGSFGRSFKLLETKTNTSVTLNGVAKYAEASGYTQNSFSNIVKTGFGALKYLQGILERSKIFDGSDRLPRILFFHNSTLGESYIVEPMQVQFDQNLSNNMMRNYSLSLSIIKSIDYGRVGSLVSLGSGGKVNIKSSLLSSVVSSTLGDIGSLIVNESIDPLTKGIDSLL